METTLSRPFRPIELNARTLAFFQPLALVEDLRREREYARCGVSAITLARDEHVTLVLVALRKGAVMREHRAPSAALVLLLSGQARFLAGRESVPTTLEPGSVTAFSADLPHAVEAVADAAYLVVIGGRARPGSTV